MCPRLTLNIKKYFKLYLFTLHFIGVYLVIHDYPFHYSSDKLFVPNLLESEATRMDCYKEGFVFVNKVDLNIFEWLNKQTEKKSKRHQMDD